MTITILGKRWRVCFPAFLGRKVEGSCETPAAPAKRISILDRLRGREFAEVALHEMLHAAAWDMLSEEYVTALAHDLARAIYRPQFWERMQPEG